MKAITSTILLATLIVSSLSSQIIRDSHYNKTLKRNVVVRYNDYALVFDSPLLSDEKIYVNAKSDSLDGGLITFFIYIYFPKNINPKGLNIVLEYADGTNDIFQQVRFDKEDNYTEYEAIGNINNISSKKVKSITLRGVKKFNISDKTYFLDFFKYL
jgi:hypothetical protein